MLLATLPFGLAASLAAWAAPPPSATVDAHGPVAHAEPTRFVMRGSQQPLARPDRDVGRADPGMRLQGLSLLLRRSPSQEARLAATLAAVQDPGSPSYHHWLTPDQYAAQFGATTGDIARVTAWLKGFGLSVEGPSRTGTRLAFSGTVDPIERAFQTEMHGYQVWGARHFAMSRAPSVPAELADVILGVHGMDDFRPPYRRHRGPSQDHPDYALPITGADGGPSVYPVLSPADFARVYDLASLHAANVTGAGQSVAVAGWSDFNDADIAAFQSQFDLPAATPERVLVPNSGANGSNSALQEAELDLEWIDAVAPGAAIRYVYVGDSPNSDVYDALNYAIEQRTASVVSLSFGRCEAQITPADAAMEEDYSNIATLEGMTIVVASGDTGAAGCDTQTEVAAADGQSVQFPASVASFVAVGGTQFDVTPANQSMYLDGQLNVVSYIPESAWNETLFDIDAGYGGLGASVGGPSHLFAKPYWQVPSTPADGQRDVPDVSLSASADTLPYAVSISWTSADGDAEAPQPETLTAFGGTSLGAPAFAGALALINEALATAHPGTPSGLGNVNPILYALANGGAGASFHDITTGNNVVPCQPSTPSCPASPPYQFGYDAGPGYDEVTGLGSIDVGALASAWLALTPTSTQLAFQKADSGAPAADTLTATVASKATATPMTGSVTFYLLPSGDGGVDASAPVAMGVVPLTPSLSAAHEQGSASLVANTAGGAAIAAFYGGDRNYLASWSTSPLALAASDAGPMDGSLGSSDASDAAPAGDALPAGDGASVSGGPAPGTGGCSCQVARTSDARLPGAGWALFALARLRRRRTRGFRSHAR